MADLLPLPTPILLILPLAVCAGVDLYLTLLVAGLYLFFSETPLGPPQPPPAGSWAVLPGLASLYLLETFAEFRPRLALFWHNLQLLLRPLGGALLGFWLAGDAASPTLTLLGGALGALVAAFVHVLSWGSGLLLRLSPSEHLPPTTFTLAQDASCLAFLALAWTYPEVGFLLGLLLLVLGLLLGAHLHGAVRFGTSMLGHRLWGILSQREWTPWSDLPEGLRRRMSDPGPGSFRGRRAGGLRLPGAGRFREGWLLDRGSRYSLVFRKGRTVGEVPLPAPPWEMEEDLPLAVRVGLDQLGGSESALFLHPPVVSLKSHK